jgi:3-oxoadipate enol-lactonase
LEVQTKHNRVGTLEVAFDEFGEGETVVLCHGQEADRRQFDGFRPFLTGLRSIAYDQRDTGETRGPETDYSMVDLGQECVDFIDTLRCDGVHLVGSSFGGMVAMQAAIASPSHVRSLTLIATSPSYDALSAEVHALDQASAEERRQFMMQAILRPSATDEDPNLEAEVSDLLTRRTPEQSMRRMAAMQSHDCTSDLGAIISPTLIVHGTEDPIAPVSAAETLAAGIKDSSSLLFPGLRHGLVFERRHSTARAISDFIAASSARVSLKAQSGQ